MICQEGAEKAYVEPDKMTQEKIEDYLLCLKLDKSIAPNSCYERDISGPTGWNDDIT